MISNLFSSADILNYVPLSDNINNEQVIENYIGFAQNEERKYWCNDALFIALLANKTDQRFLNLLNGVDSYTDTNGDLKIYEGIKPHIAFWAAAKLAKSGYIRHTDLGYMVSNSENTQRLSDTEKKAYYFEMKNKAIRYEEQTIEFLKSNVYVYPEWNYEYLTRCGVLGIYK
jgi:hypothetical protein